MYAAPSSAPLVVDYVLTITVSIAGSGNAIFSFLPPEWTAWKLPAEFAAIALLTGLNLRGVKESVQLLLPVFLVFLATHALLIGWAGGILLGNLLLGVQHTPGKTMNAILSEGLLLVVAAQAGFIDGPRVMSNMAVDSYLPHRFASLSEQLSMQTDPGAGVGGCRSAPAPAPPNPPVLFLTQPVPGFFHQSRLTSLGRQPHAAIEALLRTPDRPVDNVAANG